MIPDMEAAYKIAGVAALSLLGAFLALLSWVLISVLCFRLRGQVLLPQLTLFALKFTYSPAKSIISMFGDSLIVDASLIAAVNASMKKSFANAGPRRMLFAPQCLRSPECKARLDSRFGYVCVECGKCVIAQISAHAQRRGYRVFIVPGDRFVKRVVKEHPPDAVIGIACLGELSMAMLAGLRMGVACSGIPLTRSGCFCTEVSLDAVLSKIEESTCLKSSDG